jgi:hypothetical protein
MIDLKQLLAYAVMILAIIVVLRLLPDKPTR